MKVIHCEDCGLYVWNRKVVKAFYKFQLNNICPNCRSYGSLKREKIKRKDLKTIKSINKRNVDNGYRKQICIPIKILRKTDEVKNG